MHCAKAHPNHLSDIAEIYDRYNYAEEKRAALKRLDLRLRQIIVSAWRSPIVFSRRADPEGRLRRTVRQQVLKMPRRLRR
jgi:hypothetical protein